MNDIDLMSIPRQEFEILHAKMIEARAKLAQARDIMSAAATELHVALIQSISSDDQIIIGHVKAAHAMLKLP